MIPPNTITVYMSDHRSPLKFRGDDDMEAVISEGGDLTLGPWVDGRTMGRTTFAKGEWIRFDMTFEKEKQA